MLSDFKYNSPVCPGCGYSDLRRGIDGLYWEEGGVVLLYKRLESGSFL